MALGKRFIEEHNGDASEITVCIESDVAQSKSMDNKSMNRPQKTCRTGININVKLSWGQGGGGLSYVNECIVAVFHFSSFMAVLPYVPNLGMTNI